MNLDLGCKWTTLLPLKQIVLHSEKLSLTHGNQMFEHNDFKRFIFVTLFPLPGCEEAKKFLCRCNEVESDKVVVLDLSSA